MNIKKKYDKETGKTSWTFDQWYFKVYFWTGAVLLWFYVVAFICGFFAGVLGL